ncbi:glycosyltransferase family 2 protein [Amniculibacterium sp. G2-70]|uniref:glycosyltransferase family 2 protein n=1 Tax=Amniculibacterium sp. G2-70 TaxID=2767188 RepID=UPI0016544DE3|nr:glycosyltransferase family 2 protein [Amniculibacterium sp. G2-70]
MKISVITPVYNAEKYITQAVESALQFEEVFEVILVEDQSPDNALGVCKNLAEKYDRVKLYQHPDQGNHGAGASRNLAISKASGDYIAFLDADDFYLPNRFDAEKKLFENPEVEGVYGAIGVHYYSEKAKEQYFPIFGNKLTTVYKKHQPEEVFPGQLGMRGSFGLFSIDGLTVRKSAIDKLQPVMQTQLRLHQDTEFLFRLSYIAQLYPGSIDQAVAMRGVHESNRITQVDSGKVNPAISRVLLWNEVERWSKTQTEMPKDIQLHICRMARSWRIADASFLKKWGMIIKYLFLDFPSIKSGLYNINFRKTLG